MNVFHKDKNPNGPVHTLLQLRSITSSVKDRLPYVGRAPMDMRANSVYERGDSVEIKKNVTELWVHRIPVYNSVGFDKREVPLHTELASHFAASLYLAGDRNPLFFWGTFKEIRKFLKINDKNNEDIEGHFFAAFRTHKYIPYACIPYRGEVPEKIPQPFLRPGVPPQMNDCCEEVLDALDDLKEVLHVDLFKKSKFPVPSYLLAPGVDASKVTVANNYYNLFQQLFQALAHSTIISPKVDIQDADAVKEGDQTIDSEYLSATGWAEAVTKMLYEIVDDGNIGTNMDIRTGVTVTQLLVAVADLSHKVDCIIRPLAKVSGER